MKNTIAYQLAKGNVTHIQANEILESLYDSVNDGFGVSLDYADLSPISRQGVEILSSSFIPKDFNPSSIRFDGIEHIKTSNKDIWNLHAMTIPYGFEGDTIFEENSELKRIKIPFDFNEPKDGAPF